MFQVLKCNEIKIDSMSFIDVQTLAIADLHKQISTETPLNTDAIVFVPNGSSNKEPINSKKIQELDPQRTP